MTMEETIRSHLSDLIVSIYHSGGHCNCFLAWGFANAIHSQKEFDAKLKLHLRLPVRIEEELEIKDLHKNICRVWLPRQKSRNWCIVGFKSFDDLKEAREDLKKQKINGKKIIVKPFTQGSSQIKRKVAVKAAADITQFQSLLELAKQS